MDDKENKNAEQLGIAVKTILDGLPEDKKNSIERILASYEEARPFGELVPDIDIRFFEREASHE